MIVLNFLQVSDGAPNDPDIMQYCHLFSSKFACRHFSTGQSPLEKYQKFLKHFVSLIILIDFCRRIDKNSSLQ